MTESCPVPTETVEDLLSQLSVLGVNGFFYGIGANPNPGQDHPYKKLEKRLPLKMAKVRYAIFSDEKIRRLRDTYLKVFARHDECYFEKKAMGPNLWRQPDSTQHQLIKLLKESDINSRVIWLLPTKYHKSWVNTFMLYSSLSDKEMKAAIDDNSDKINRLLELYGEYFSSKYIHLLNPVYNFHCMTPTSKTILEMAAEGVSTQRIAKALFLSERGVIYHLDKMKVIFGANNRAQLVSRAFQMGIMNALESPS